jgi:site-specific DNA-cytosine methylase
MFGDVITDIPQPKDRNVMFQDILIEGYTDRKKARAVLESEERQLTNKDKLYKRYMELGMINIVFDNPEFLPNENLRILNKIELCRLQGFPDNYCDILTRNKAASLLGDGWTLPIIEHIFKFIKQ